MASPSSAPISTAADAFAAIALAAVACDGELASLEARSLRQQLEFREPYCRFSDQAMGDLLDRLLQLLREQGWQALVMQAAPLLAPEAAETALAVAASLTQADHVESSAEQTFLTTLSQALAIDGERARVIVDVVAILHRDSLAS
ncbi:MAG: hypothetical protein FJ057_01680 [Cyanobacteria bacterium K_DeepCast_0m_m1_088]|jgi:hypothetical protein|nr:hypothetical protein [Cyanobacteria bacterium K_DeepCast_0m_m1_088]